MLERRDAEVLASLERDAIHAKAVAAIGRVLAKDRQQRRGFAAEPLLLNASDDLAPHIGHLRSVVFPAAEEQARCFTEELAILDEKIARGNRPGSCADSGPYRARAGGARYCTPCAR